MSALITLSDVCVKFDNKLVLDKINLEISPEKIVTIIGPNGAGKSTLIKVMLHLIQPTSGNITKKGNLRIGYVPQKLHLNETLPLTVDRFLKLAGNYPRQRRQEVLSQVGASHLETNDMHQLSGGENQRVLLARALLRQPDLLVLDEPAQGVDVQGQIELYQLIRQIKNDLKCAIVMVSHDLHLVMAQTDEVICLQHHICCSGNPEDISQHPSYLKLFGYQAQDTLAIYQHQHHHQHCLSGEPKSCHEFQAKKN